MENKRKSAPKKESGAKSENSKGKRTSASAGRQPEKKGAAKKTAKKAVNTLTNLVDSVQTMMK